MLLVIDNYDSFTYNLVQLLGDLGAELRVARNDAIDVETAQALAPGGMVISPGPGRPEASGVSRELVRAFRGRIPILGVCLGHQCIGDTSGGRIVPAANLMHGKTSRIYHDGRTIFQGLGNPFEATRYHSLVIEEETLPAELEVSAHTADGEIMGVRLRGSAAPVEGVQFHPESILTTEGRQLLRNFLDLTREHEREARRP
jgi:anthranilate synthase/aminodeoxychorismate synthase-like glutamine amidotransferase